MISLLLLTGSSPVPKCKTGFFKCQESVRIITLFSFLKVGLGGGAKGPGSCYQLEGIGGRLQQMAGIWKKLLSAWCLTEVARDAQLHLHKCLLGHWGDPTIAGGTTSLAESF